MSSRPNGRNARVTATWEKTDKREGDELIASHQVAAANNQGGIR
jgi:hypothetical protein